MKVIFTPHARRDLKELRRYIAQESYPDRADDYVRRIVKYCEGFSTFPMRGTARDDLLPGLRTTGFERRVTILFFVTEEEVLIEAIDYGGRSYESRYGNA